MAQSSTLMQEKTQPGQDHRHPILLCGCYDVVVSESPAGLGNVLHMTAARSIDIVLKWDKGIRAETNTVILLDPRCPLLVCQRLRRGAETCKHGGLFRFR